MTPGMMGWEAALAGEASCSCPFEEGSDAWAAWRDAHAAGRRIIERETRDFNAQQGE